MKKLIILIIILTAGFVLGENTDGSSDGTTNTDKSLTEDTNNLLKKPIVAKKINDIKTDARKTIENTKPFVTANKRRVNARIESFKQEKKQEMFQNYKKAKLKARIITKEKIQEKKQQFITTKKNYLEKRQIVIQEKQLLNELKQEVLDCEGECTEEREKYRNQVKESLIKNADAIINYLGNIKLKTESSESLSEDEANEITTSINEKIAEMESLKEQLQNAQTKDEIKEIARKIKQTNKRIRNHARLHTAKVINANLGNIALRANQISIKLEKVLSRLEEAGEDTTELNTLVDEYNTKVESAKENYRLAREKFKEIRTENDENFKEGIDSIKTYLNNAKTNLKEAKELVKEITSIIRNLKGNTILEEASNEVESEEVTE